MVGYPMAVCVILWQFLGVVGFKSSTLTAYCKFNFVCPLWTRTSVMIYILFASSHKPLHYFKKKISVLLGHLSFTQLFHDVETL